MGRGRAKDRRRETPQGLAWLAGHQHQPPPHPPSHPPPANHLIPRGTRAKPPGPAPRLRSCPPRDLVPAAWAAPSRCFRFRQVRVRRGRGSGGRAGGAAFVWGRVRGCEPPLPGPSLPRPRLLLSPISCCPSPSHLATGPDVLSTLNFLLPPPLLWPAVPRHLRASLGTQPGALRFLRA